MKLTQYLKSKRLTAVEFAGIVGVPVGTLRKWKRGERYPQAKFMRQILQASEGEVTPNDFFDVSAARNGEAA